MAYSIGSLVSVAFNNPKKFPKAEDYLRDEDQARRVVKTLDEQRAVLGRIATRVN